MSTNTIYVFSGSGNCLDIAKNIARKLGDTDIVLMRSAPEKTDATDSRRVGFVFPCYAGGLPAGVENSFRAVRIAPAAHPARSVAFMPFSGVFFSRRKQKGRRASPARRKRTASKVKTPT